MSINWITRKVKSLFQLKTKTFIQSARYHGFSSCKEKYISESKRNTENRRGEHNYPTHDLEPEKHLTKSTQHS